MSIIDSNDETCVKPMIANSHVASAVRSADRALLWLFFAFDVLAVAVGTMAVVRRRLILVLTDSNAAI